jgi:hypothetical protein
MSHLHNMKMFISIIPVSLRQWTSNNYNRLSTFAAFSYDFSIVADYRNNTKTMNNQSINKMS